MNLVADAISVLGSRHGILLDPVAGNARIIRFDMFHEAAAFEIRAGLRIDGQEFVFPLCREGRRFAFFDQRITPCTSRLIGIHEDSGIKVALEFATPFRPKDPAFSTIPIIAARVSVSKISGNFRWHPVKMSPESVEVFFEVSSEDMEFQAAGPAALDVSFSSLTLRSSHEKASDPAYRLQQLDRIVAPGAKREGNRFSIEVPVCEFGSRTLDVFWCAHSEPVLEVLGTKHPFLYANRFESLEAVTDWARSNGTEIFTNAETVDAIVGANTLGPSINNLLAQTLHSWLINTWWVDRDGRDWFSVWEGSCGFHSTVDVEFTQSPFYLTVWPELLGIELDYWPEFSKPGTRTLGGRGEGTEFLSHDCGAMAAANGQDYPHEMEVEETANYLIMLFAHWRRTGDFSIARKWAGKVAAYLLFLERCDTAGKGVPDVGVANTIDDGAPALQYGREQVYLAVKTLAAFQCGAAILEELGDAAKAAHFRKKAEFIRGRVESEGWKNDHYICLLNTDGRGLKNPWTGKDLGMEIVPGWDGHHIYTANGLAPLDMVGFSSGLDEGRLATDLVNAAEACLCEYGCSHSDYAAEEYALGGLQDGMAGVSAKPGWISMNMLRDIAAFYRGLDFRHLSERYWNWQLTTNSQSPALFFETFGGNYLHFYPRGVAVWGFFDALAGLVIDRVAGVDSASPRIPGIKVPRLFDADWSATPSTHL
jgi:xylan 1,4-beta-xylosidase